MEVLPVFNGNTSDVRTMVRMKSTQWACLDFTGKTSLGLRQYNIPSLSWYVIHPGINPAVINNIVWSDLVVMRPPNPTKGAPLSLICQRCHDAVEPYVIGTRILDSRWSGRYHFRASVFPQLLSLNLLTCVCAGVQTSTPRYRYRQLIKSGAWSRVS